MDSSTCRLDSIAIMGRSHIFCALSALLACTGCPLGEDSWKHYTGGGHYPSTTPAMSPDGSVIVFSSPQSGNGDIYQIARDGSNRTRLTDYPGFETDPIFSPAGSTIAFARENDGCRHVWLMDSDGSNQRQLTNGRVLDDVRKFSPDGSELVFGRSPLSLGMGRTITYYAVNLDNKKVRKLEGFVEYSPDGRQIAYQIYNDSNSRFEIWLMDADRSNKQFLVEGHLPRFSADGKMILFTTESTHPGKLWEIIDVDGSNRRELGRVEGPVFAGDGEHVLCLSPEWRRRIWKMKIDGPKEEAVQVLRAPVGYVAFFRPCRDGFILKIVTNDRVGDIYIVNTDDWSIEHVASMR